MSLKSNVLCLGVDVHSVGADGDTHVQQQRCSKLYKEQAFVLPQYIKPCSLFLAFFFFLFSFFAEKWTQISRATATVWLIPSPFSQILRITSLLVISKTDLKGIVSVSRPYTFSYRNCGFIYLFFNKRKHGIKQTNKQKSSRQLHNLFRAKPRRFNHNCATIHRRDRELETSQCPGQSPRHHGTPIGTPRAAFCSRGQAERVLSRAKAFSLSID